MAKTKVTPEINFDLSGIESNPVVGRVDGEDVRGEQKVRSMGGRLGFRADTEDMSYGAGVSGGTAKGQLDLPSVLEQFGAPDKVEFGSGKIKPQDYDAFLEMADIFGIKGATARVEAGYTPSDYEKDKKRIALKLKYNFASGGIMPDDAREQAMQDAKDIDTGVDTRSVEDRLAQQMDAFKTIGKVGGELAVESIPGVSEEISMQNIQDALARGDKAGAGIEAGAMALGVVPLVGDAAAKLVRAATKKYRQGAKLRVDNPGYDEFYKKTYAELKQEYADEAKKKALSQGQIDTYAANIGSSDGITGSANNIKFSPKELKTIPGSMGEEKFRSTGQKLINLKRNIAEEGYKPDNILIHVREDGQPFIVEGNHRLAEALDSGRETITADIKYLRGAEEKEGLLDPKNIFPSKKTDDISVKNPIRTTKSPVRKLLDELPQKEIDALPAQPDENRVFGYHGTARARTKDEPFFDINFARKNDQFLGEGFYFTLDPKIADEYANLRAFRDFDLVEQGGRGKSPVMKHRDTGEVTTVDNLLVGKNKDGEPLAMGQHIGRFDLSNLEKPYVVRTEKQRKQLKAMLPELKEQGYDSVLFADFKDRSKQIMVFPEHMDKINSDAINYAEGGAVPMKEQMSMFEDGGLMDEGGSIDPVSGNDVPPGSTQEEVRDDIPAQLSEGEFVFPADVVRFIGLSNLMSMRQEAKMGLKQMEAMGQMGNSEEATMPDDLPFDLNDLDMEDDGVVQFAEGGLADANTNTGVYYTPAASQSTGVSAIPEAASSTYQAPQQYTTPTVQQVVPEFESFIKPEEGMQPEIREYINTKTGEKMSITFINNQPTVAIPTDFVPASEYVAPETVASQTSRVKSAAVQSTMDEPAGREEIEKEEAMYGPGGGRVSVGSNLYGVSFSGKGMGLKAPAAMAMTALGLATGKPIPAEAVVNFQRPDNGLPNGVDKFSVTGTAYNNFKAIAEKHGYNSRQAQKAMQEMRYDAKVIQAQKAADEVKEAEERVTITGSDESYDSSASGAGLESSVRGSSSPGGTGGTVTTETGTTGQGRQDYTGGTQGFDNPSGDSDNSSSSSSSNDSYEDYDFDFNKGGSVTKQMKRSGLASK